MRATGRSVVAATPAPGDRAGPGPSNPTWWRECGACHVAYPPRLLAARDWQSVTDSLAQHFGADVGLDPSVARQIRASLVSNAGGDRPARDGPTRAAATGALLETGTPSSLPRIRATAWFRDEHDEVRPALCRSPAVTTPANCGACHPGADAGDFGEDAVRIPR